ncbi:hypothetical protein CHLRE_16g670151v5 [Chlamydomonas reinhardtii]|uniref:Uncharacterized protein n=1 Tax=Chlamydomonas reinhardtii TaxID=3055 RepID=A0A2K3CU94_CHLRE|nr:uncharacterized protein CHLRE_16g670151v5 [Chlamydomonas reinhardtii]PNW71859.1 hypothetical protein CHLRE_16g670151v5 [Chlamydomonas reinhardtii]
MTRSCSRQTPPAPGPAAAGPALHQRRGVRATSTPAVPACAAAHASAAHAVRLPGRRLLPWLRHGGYGTHQHGAYPGGSFLAPPQRPAQHPVSQCAWQAAPQHARTRRPHRSGHAEPSGPASKKIAPLRR